MLSRAQELKVAELIAEGLSERQIAKRSGVSRGTVHARKTGIYPRRRKEFFFPDGGIEGRCSCGAWVILPCRACQLRRHLGILRE